MIQTLEVHLWGHKAGTLIAYKEHFAEKTCFYFDKDFLAKGYDIAPVRASIRNPAFNAGLPVYGESMSVNGKTAGITRTDLLSIAHTYNIKNPGSIIDNILSVAAGYNLYAHEAGVDAGWQKRISEKISSRFRTID